MVNINGAILYHLGQHEALCGDTSVNDRKRSGCDEYLFLKGK
jgi:hypothetical protein